MTLPTWWYDELRSLASRSKEVVGLAAVVGVITGLAVVGFQWTVDVVLEWTFAAPLWLQMILPTIGLALVAVVLRFPGKGTTPSTADEYILVFHDPGRRQTARAFWSRVVGAFLTLGSGGALGLEGPSIYMGSAIGQFVHHRLPPRFRGEARVLVVAGAAAGVAAIFKAPATGAVFALEVPYQDDLARRSLLPALVAAATGYLTFAAFEGTSPLFPIVGDVGFGAKDLVAAVVLGVFAGAGARAFAWLIRRAKSFQARSPAPVKVLVGGGVMAGALALSRILTGESLTLGPGYDAVTWALEPGNGFWVLAVVLVLRCVASAATLAGGGASGLFVPLVVAGALLGQMVATLVGEPSNPLFLVVGVAAFLGAGYRVPLAAVVFVAESTGRASFVVPGLIAAVASELLMGTSSVTAYQQRPDLIDRA